MSWDEAEIEKRKQNWLNKRWDQARGVSTFDLNNGVILVRASVEEVAQALAPDAVVWERDVIDREICLERAGCFIFRLRGHVWTEIVDYWESPVSRTLGKDWVKSLSKTLKTRAVDYNVSDSCASVGYTLWDDGELLEEFEAIEDSSEDDEDEDEEVVANPPDPNESKFFSKLRTTTLAEIRNIWDFVHHFFVEQDAYDPGVKFLYFLDYHPPKPLDRVKVRNPGFTLAISSPYHEVTSTPEIERIDYMAFGRPIERSRERNPEADTGGSQSVGSP